MTHYQHQEQPAESAAPLAQRLMQLPPSERDQTILEAVLAEIADVLGYATPEAVDANRPFTELGVTSQAAVELYTRLTDATGLEVPVSVVFSYPTPATLACHLRTELEGDQPSSTPLPAGRRNSEEPIAIVGIGCRFPGGVGSAEQLWELVRAGTDAVSEFPRDRGWDVESVFGADTQHPASTGACAGGFLYDAGEFDPAFFGISPREALAMDPQQRLLLQTAWEAFEDGGIDPVSMEGSETGVFIGLALQDYGMLLRSARSALQGHLATGTSASVASGRIAYAFGLEGSALTVDTACSSSLVAIHLACLALRAGECSAALAGGATVMATTSVLAEFHQLGALSRDGRCRSFAASADGTSFGEGAGLLVLERLSDAQRQGHRILAVVRGSAVNSDGASHGLTAPNGRAQERVIRQALTNADLSAGDIDVVEAHGTGTALGDPIEAHALLATYGRAHSPTKPLHLASLKSNIGHTQAAAGVGGVIKMVMALLHDELPKTLHVDEPSLKIDWSSGTLALLTEPLPWPKTDRTRRAGVSAFGVSGTNAHLVLEEAPTAPARNTVDTERGPPISAAPWMLSAKTPDSLVRQAERLHAHLEAHPAVAPLDIAYSLATTRSHFKHRAAVVGDSRDDLLNGVAALSHRRVAPNVVQAAAVSSRRLAFMFTGQGSQRPKMAKALYESFPAFAEALDAVCACIDSHLDRPIRDIMFAGAGSPESRLLDQTGFTQPALFAVEVALFRLLDSWELRPDYLIGHSIGELAAAHAAGILSLADASALVAARGSLMQALPDGGAMVAVEASEDEVAPTLAGLEGLAIAAVNGPRSVVVSGDRDAATEWAKHWQEQGRKATWLRVSHAFHSPRMDAMLSDFARVAAGAEFLPPEIPLVSTVSGTVSADEITSSEYWVRQVREPVRFFAGMRWLATQRVATYLELGPGGVLSALAHTCVSSEKTSASQELEPFITPTMRAGQDERQTLLRAVAELHAHGIRVDWQSVFTGQGARRVQLSTYAFARQRFWPNESACDTDEGPQRSSVERDMPASPAVVGPVQPVWQHVTDLPPEEQLGALLEIIRSAAASVLGHASAAHVDPDTPLLELGLDSLGAVKLGESVGAAVGLPVPAALLRDNPTATSFAAELHYELTRNSAAPERQTVDTAGDRVRAGTDVSETLTATTHHALHSGRGKDLIALLMNAARLQPTFDAGPSGERHRTTLIARGNESPRLICIPSFVAGSGPHQFLRIGACCEHARTVTGLALPGFRHGEGLPASREALVDTLAALVQNAAADEPFALLGYSSGGIVAHAVTERLEEDGTMPAAVVLLDVYQPAREELADVFAAVLAQLVQIDHAFVALTDEQLLAMGAYIGLFEDWAPRTLQVPSILLRAHSPLHASLNYAQRISAWQLATREVEVPGNHFSIIDADANSTAQALQQVLEDAAGTHPTAPTPSRCHPTKQTITSHGA